MSKKTLLDVATFGLASAVLKDEKKKKASAAATTATSSSATTSTTDSGGITGRQALMASATAQGDLGNALLGSNRLLGN